MINQQIAQRIKNKCKENKISVNQLTKDCGLGKSLIYDMETKNSSPSVDKIMIIADYLNCSVNYLLGIAEKSDKNISGDNNGIQADKIDSSTINLAQPKNSSLDEMSKELLERFQSLSFDDKLDVFVYIKNKKGA